jgi:hypothetical protein
MKNMVNIHVQAFVALNSSITGIYSDQSVFTRKTKINASGGME